MEDPMSDLTLDVKTHSKPASAAERAALLQNPAFGRVFTDHMTLLSWSAERGWHDWTLEHRRALTLDPATLSLPYALAMFQGLKAYRLPDGGTRRFPSVANPRPTLPSAHRNTGNAA